MNPCATSNPCSPQAICQTDNHRAVCTCPIGMTGDPYTKCNPSKCLFVISFTFDLVVNVNLQSHSSSWMSEG